MNNKRLNEIILTALDFYKIPHYMDVSDSEKNILYIDTGYKAKSNVRMIDAYTITEKTEPGFYEIFCNLEVNGIENIVTLSEVLFGCGLIRRLFY